MRLARDVHTLMRRRLCTETFRCLDFYAPKLLDARGKNVEKYFFQNNFFFKDNFFVSNKFFFQKNQLKKFFFSKSYVSFKSKIFSKKKQRFLNKKVLLRLKC